VQTPNPSISPTFYKQLLRLNPLAKKLQIQNCKNIKAAQKLSYEKAARKILVKLTPDWSFAGQGALNKDPTV
jgi:hypothetical protein